MALYSIYSSEVKFRADSLRFVVEAVSTAKYSGEGPSFAEWSYRAQVFVLPRSYIQLRGKILRYTFYGHRM